MDSLQSTYNDEEPPSNTNHLNSPTPPTAMEIDDPRKHSQPPTLHATQPTPNGAIPPRKEDAVKLPEDIFVSASESLSESEHNPKTEDEEDVVEEEDDDEEEAEEEGDEDLEEENRHPSKKHKPLSSLTQQPKKEEPEPETALPPPQNDTTANNSPIENNVPKEKPQTPAKAPVTASSKKKSKSKKKTTNSVWVTRSTRKGKKKAKPNPQNAPAEDKVLITPVPRFFDKNDDAPEMNICLSKVYKAEKVELSEDRLSAGSTKGYRMVRATRGVSEGAWYYEIKVVRLGESGHTRLGWSTEKGDLQAPVGYDGNSFGYRDVDGSKVHKALREKYGEEGYKEGDVVGFYINLPGGGSFAPKPPQLVWYKGQRYHCAQDPKEDPPKIVPGSEISFFKNGVCQGVAFKDLYGGCYYPAASMYTLPSQPNCEVKFNFGPDFEFFPEDFGGRPVPRPMIEVPYHGYDSRVENGASDERKQ